MNIHIIGGGVAGLCTAWYLRQAGFEVTVLDQGDLMDGCSHGNAGMIVPSHFIPMAAPGVITQGIRWMFNSKSPFYIKPRLNAELLQWLWQFYRSCTPENVREAMPVLRDFNNLSKKLYHNFAQTDGFDFDYEARGLLMLCKNPKTLHEEAEVAEKAHALGLEAKVLNASEVQQLEANIKLDVTGGVFYPGDAHLYSNKFMTQLKTALRNSGVVLLSHKKVNGFETTNGRINKILLANNEQLNVEHVVLAAGSWSAKVLKMLGIRLLMQDGKGYSITLEHPVIKPLYPTILLEARVAITPMGSDLRIGGTLEISNLSTKINPARLAGILESVPQYYPELKPAMPPLDTVWHGFRPCTPDGLPYIGRSEKFANLTYATGHAMMGMSLGPATGKLVTEMIQNQKPSIDVRLFRPERFG
ncbi:MAG TPA: FAD-dependent oxidoreductase [Saprospiraceae bacterium]|nr:FAD-dependent oxidoreductase [Saprospiraceae bacterium]HMP22963.1 FAD-dependent oxidoreductase [Saprospiraceae bacterium]